MFNIRIKQYLEKIWYLEKLISFRFKSYLPSFIFSFVFNNNKKINV